MLGMIFHSSHAVLADVSSIICCLTVFYHIVLHLSLKSACLSIAMQDSSCLYPVHSGKVEMSYSFLAGSLSCPCNCFSAREPTHCLMFSVNITLGLPLPLLVLQFTFRVRGPLFLKLSMDLKKHARVSILITSSLVILSVKEIFIIFCMSTSQMLSLDLSFAFKSPTPLLYIYVDQSAEHVVLLTNVTIQNLRFPLQRYLSSYKCLALQDETV